jgi:hypothetical protein
MLEEEDLMVQIWRRSKMDANSFHGATSIGLLISLFALFPCSAPNVRPCLNFILLLKLAHALQFPSQPAPACPLLPY